MVTRFIHELDWLNVPEATQHQVKRCLLDLVGVHIGGRATQLSQIIYDHAGEMYIGELGLPFSRRRSNPLGLALATGMTIDALDGHDGHNLCKGHVGCGSLSAVLAMSLNGETDSEEFLTRLLLGYELGTRLGTALHQSVPDYHTSGAWIAVASAAIGARAFSLDKNTTNEALGIAEYHGPRSQMMRGVDHPTMVKDGSGWGAMAGISAAYLAKAGFTGAPALTIKTPDHIWHDLGQNWQIHSQYFKPYPVCRWAQAAIEAARMLRDTYKIQPENISEIEIHSFHQCIRLAGNSPKTTEEAQYSTSFPTAIALARGTVRAEDVTDNALQDPLIRSLANRITLVEDEDANDAFPARRYARVVLRLNDGKEFESDWHEPRWEPNAPPSDEELIEKFTAYTAPYMSAPRQSALIETIFSLDKQPLAEFFALIEAPLHLPPQFR